MVPPTLDLSVLRTFALIAQGRTFAQTADIVGRSPSAVSLQVQRLEQDIGAPVFRRNNQGVELTMAGERLLGFAQQLLQLNDDALLCIRPDRRQRIAFGVTPDLAEGALPEIIQRFSLEHPEADVTLRVDASRALVEAVHLEDLDFAIALTRDDPLNQGAVCQTAMIWIARQGFCVRAHRPLPLALLDPPCPFRLAALDSLGPANRSYRIAASSPSLGGLVAAVRTGLCVTARTKRLLGPALVDVGSELALPSLPPMAFCLYARLKERRPARDDLIQLCRRFL